MKSLRHVTILSIALAVCTPVSWAAAEVGVFEALPEFTREYVVVLGRVESVRNVKVLFHGRPRIRPEISISVQQMFAGAPRDTVKILGVNTFYQDDGEWMTVVSEGMPLLIPGDQVVVAAAPAEVVWADMGARTTLRLRSASFVVGEEDGSAAGGYNLFQYTRSYLTVDLAHCTDCSLESILSAVVRIPGPCDHALEDFPRALSEMMAE